MFIVSFSWIGRLGAARRVAMLDAKLIGLPSLLRIAAVGSLRQTFAVAELPGFAFV
jgi:hypothetical protein